MMRRHVPLIVTLLSLACGNEPTSPSATLGRRPIPPFGCVVRSGIRRICRFQAGRCRWLRQVVALSP
jgi:hypothetical protein